jgi:hypothetical protein
MREARAAKGVASTRFVLVTVVGLSTGCWLVAGLEERRLLGADLTAPESGAPDAVGPSPGDGEGGPTAETDAGACDPRAPFTVSTRISSLSTIASERGATLSSDELEIYFTTQFDFAAGAAAGLSHIYRATRSSTTTGFGPPERVFPAFAVEEADPAMTRDGRTLYFSARGATISLGSYDIYSAGRRSKGGPFAGGTLLEPVSSTAYEASPTIAADHTEMILSHASPSYELVRAARDPDSGVFGKTAPLADLTPSKAPVYAPVLSADGLTLYFAYAPSVANQIWRAHRTSKDGPFGPGEAVAEVNIGTNQLPVWLSDDACHLYVSQDRGEGTLLDLWLFVRSPGAATR